MSRAEKNMFWCGKQHRCTKSFVEFVSSAARLLTMAAPILADINALLALSESLALPQNVLNAHVDVIAKKTLPPI